MDKFTQAVRSAIVDPKPVMHSYVCTVAGRKGIYLFPMSRSSAQH